MFVNKKMIWCVRQGKPTYIVYDLEPYGIPASTVYWVLLKRGAFKWFAVRRDLIHAKDEWKREITRLQKEIEKLPKGSPERARLVGRMEGIVMCRQQVREMCHSARWRAPDNDEEAIKFLEILEGK